MKPTVTLKANDESLDVVEETEGKFPSREQSAARKRKWTTSTPDIIKKDYVDYRTLEKIRVICRFRPSNKREQREEKQMGLEHSDPEVDGQAVTVKRRLRKDVASSPKDRKKTFFLDNIIDWKSSQSRCFRVIGFPMVESVLAGYNATIFAYGQTGSGKTYTMFGPEDMYSPRHVGLIQRSMAMLFKSLNERMERKTANLNEDRLIEGFTVSIQFLQIYREKLYDLLNPINEADLRIRFNPRTKAPYVENITMNVVHNTKDVLRLTKMASSNRITDKTDMNAVSSRSHLVMTVTVEQNKSDGTKVTSKLNFGDLAGSESTRKTGVKLGSRQFKELKAINLSLSQLTTVMNDIVNNRRPAFRSSKLTYLLQDSLGGNTKTTVVVCCSPHITNRDETIRTLTLAKNAKSIKNKAKVNKEYTSSQYKKIISNLTAENERLKITNSNLESKLHLAELSANVVKSDEYKDLMLRQSELENQIRSQREADSKIIQELKDQLRLKNIDLDASLLQVQKLQGESQRESDDRQSLADQIDELREKFESTRTQLDELTAEKVKFDLSVETLEEQLREKSVVIKQQRKNCATFEDRVQILEEDLISKNLKIQDLVSQNLLLTSNVQQAATSLSAEEILKKYHLDEPILASLKFDLSQVLITWRNRHKQIVTEIPSENTTIAFEVRSVIKFFELAMTQLEKNENTQNQRDDLLAQIQKYQQEIRGLKRTIDSLENQILELKIENEAFYQTKEKSNKTDNFDNTLDDELLNYLSFKASQEFDYESPGELDDEESKEAQAALFGTSTAPKSDIDWRISIKVGDFIDALDPTDLWFKASVLNIKNDGDGDRLLIHYVGFDNKYDEWIPRFNQRLSKAGSKAAGGKESGGVDHHTFKVIGEKNGESYLKDGWMHKKSPGMLKVKFRCRYFVLFPSGMLRYYTNERDQEPRGSINLCLVKKIKMDKADYRQNIFEFSLHKSAKVLCLRVNSQKDMDGWIASLKAVRLKVIADNSTEWFEFHRPNNDLNVDVRLKCRKRLLDDEMTNSPRRSFSEVETFECIHQGNLWKMGGNIRSWNKRFFELLDNKTIVYYEEESTNGQRPASKKRGSIDIWGVLRLKQLTRKEFKIVNLPKECAAGMKVETTNTGVLIVGMESVEHLEKWKNAIAENCVFAGEKSKSGHHRRSSSGTWAMKKIGDYFSSVQSTKRSSLTNLSDIRSYFEQRSQNYPAGESRPNIDIETDMPSYNQNTVNPDEPLSPSVEIISLKDHNCHPKLSYLGTSSKFRESLSRLGRENYGKFPFDLQDLLTTDDREDSDLERAFKGIKED